MSYSISAEEVMVKKIDHSSYKLEILLSLQLSVRIYRDNIESLNESRSRYARFVHYELVGCKHRVVPRDREPTRVPVKRLARLLHKSRNIGKMVRQYIVRNIPISHTNTNITKK